MNSLATQRSVCVVVQLATRRKVRMEVQRNTDGDTPSICVDAHADLRICGGHVYRIDWAPVQFVNICLLRQYNKH